MACLYGMPEECGGWAYLARYDRYIVMTQFMHAGHPAGMISEQTFGELVQSVDDFAARSLIETP